jgi:subtilisin family serine protease
VLSNDCNPSGCTASGTSGDVAAGIRWAVANGADVINLSLGGGAMQSALGCAFCDAIEEAWAQGVIAVVAAGNDSILPAGFGDAHAVVVTATNRDDQRASYSNQNGGVLTAARWPVAAPGGEAEADPADCGTGGQPAGILSTFLSSGGNGYACLAGTSMAAPHVTGGLALLLSAGLTPQQAIDRLLGTATDLGPAGRDSSYGFGRIDLAKALDQLSANAVGGGSETPTVPSGPEAPGGSASTIPVPTTVAVPTSDVPVVSPPDTSLAAPFTLTPEPGRPAPAEDPAGWLVVLAVGAAALAALGTSATAWHLSRGR